MVQSKNFYETDGDIPPANISGRWCPTDNLTGFDLNDGDKVIFIRTKGASKQNVNKSWSRNSEIFDDWYLDELWVGKVTIPIKSRQEYCMIKGIPANTPLWYDETKIGKSDKRLTQRKTTGIRWNRVFEFRPVVTLSSLNINIKKLNNIFPDFVKATLEIYVGQGSREITLNQYTSLMEYIAGLQNEYKNQLMNYFPEYISDEQSMFH
jgi:hypothetical protein